jgi:Zn-dependent peptidase ImmA (M78 family)
VPARRPEREAQRLLERFGITAVPVDVEALAGALGARIRRQRLSHSISGLLYRDADQIVIGVNERQPKRRQRFTVAHEVGHLAMHPGRPLLLDASVRVNWRDDDSAAASDREEIEANTFAAAILMPASLVRRELDALLSGPASSKKDLDQIIKHMADRFEVSTQAMHFRLLALGLQLSS